LISEELLIINLINRSIIPHVNIQVLVLLLLGLDQIINAAWRGHCFVADKTVELAEAALAITVGVNKIWYGLLL
jgi:hypothetical protein